MYDALNSEQEYQITLEEQDEKFIPYKFSLNRQDGSYSAEMRFYTMNIEKGAIFDLLIKDDDNNIYFNELKIFTGVTGDTIGNFSYNVDTSTYNTELNSMFDAVKNGKKITMTLSFYDYDSSTDKSNLNGQVDEYVFEPSDAICIKTNSLNECIEYFWGNKNLLIID